MNIFQKLQLARIKLQGSKLEKTGRNDYAGYDYFELGDFLPQAQTIFCDLGLCGIVSYSLEGCNLIIYNAEKPDERIVFNSPWAEAQLKGCHPIQNLGAAETYQRRYLWVTALEIVEHDALDATTGSDGERKAEMVMTNRLVPKHYWDATDPIAKAKILGEGNSIRKNDEDKKWYICEPANKQKAAPQPELPAIPPATEEYERWEGQVIHKIIEKNTAAGMAYWEIATGEAICVCKNEKLVEDLKLMNGEELILLVKQRVSGKYELMDFEGSLA